LIEDGLIEAMNKIDLLEPTMRVSLVNQVQRRNTDSVALSRRPGRGATASCS